MPDEKTQAKIIGVSVGLSALLVLGSNYFTTPELPVTDEEPAVVIDETLPKIDEAESIVFETEQEYIDTKKELNDVMIDTKVILTGADPYILSDLLLYEKGDEYARAKSSLKDRVGMYLGQGGELGNDEWIVAVSLINEKIRADGGWSFEGVNQDELGEALYVRIMEDVFEAKPGEYPTYIKLDPPAPGVPSVEPAPIEEPVVDDGGFISPVTE